jgi:TIR domain
MAYVPGFDYDLFFSYAQHDSPEWIGALEAALREELADRLGSDFALWRDKSQIRFGQVWPDEITEGVQKSAAFLAVVSQNYLDSDWCARERQLFLEQGEEQLKVGRYHRFLKLVRRALRDNVEEGFLGRVQEVRFFQEGTSFSHGTKEFRAKVEEACQWINALLEAMRRSREAVFVALCIGDTLQAGCELQKELLRKGYDARPGGPLDKNFSDDKIETAWLDPALLSVHLLGGSYDPFVEHLIDLAVKLDKRLVFWLTPQANDPRNDRQRRLIEAIRNGQKGPPKAILESPNSRVVIDAVLDLLKPKPSAAPANADGQAPRVYVLHDPRTAEDAERAREIQAQILEKEKMQVDLPYPAAQDGLPPSDLH